MSVKLSELEKILDGIAPKALINNYYDNVGLIVGGYCDILKKVLCCLDVTNDVIDEAIQESVDLIISHHPLVWKSFNCLDKFTKENLLNKKIYKLIKNSIGVYCMHTNLDFVQDGINDKLAQKFGLKNHVVLYNGIGRIGGIQDSIDIYGLRNKVAKILDEPYVRLYKANNKKVSTIAVINGAGGGDEGIVLQAKRKDAEVLITSEVKHNVAVLAREIGLNILEFSHYKSEKFYIPYFVSLLKEKCSKANLQLEIISTKEMEIELL